MMKKYTIIFLLIFVFVTIIVFVIYQDNTHTAKNDNYPPANYPTEVSENYPFYTISQLNQMNESGIFNTEGYLVYLSYCPPCPSDVDCAMCESPHIVISERNNFTEGTYFENIRIGKIEFRYSLSKCQETELVIDYFSDISSIQETYPEFRWLTWNEWAYPFELDMMYKFTLEIVKPQESVYYPRIYSCPRHTIIGKIIGIEKVE